MRLKSGLIYAASCFMAFACLAQQGPDALALTVQQRAGVEAMVGQPIDLVFSLTNKGDKAFVFPKRSCGIVHEVRWSAVDPDGQLIVGLGRIDVGGPHCFCRTEANITLASGQSVELPTSTTNAAMVVAWAPDKAGIYEIRGLYEAISSPPLKIEVREGKAADKSVSPSR